MAEGVIRRFIELDMEQDADDVYNDALAAIHALKDDPVVGMPLGITTFSELSVPLVARLCDELGLPSSSAQAVDVARNKHETRRAMKEAGLATIRNCLIASEADIDEGIRVVGFPAVLKPISGAASLGVKKVYDAADLRAGFIEVRTEMENTIVTSGALVKSSTADCNLQDMLLLPAPEKPGSKGHPPVVFMCGAPSPMRRLASAPPRGPNPPIRAQKARRALTPLCCAPIPRSAGSRSIWTAWRWTWTWCCTEARRTTRRSSTTGPQSSPTSTRPGASAPAGCPRTSRPSSGCAPPRRAPRSRAADARGPADARPPRPRAPRAACALQELGIASLRACGFTQGVFHVELKYTSRGPRLIEINARMGGGQVRETHRRVFGVDLVEETLFACVGIPCRPHKADPPLCHLAYNYVNARRSGLVTDISAVRQLDAREDVVYARPLVAEGGQVVGPDEGMPTWVADIMVCKQDGEEALEYVLALSDSLVVGVEPARHVLEKPMQK